MVYTNGDWYESDTETDSSSRTNQDFFKKKINYTKLHKVNQMNATKLYDCMLSCHVRVSE